MPSAKTPRMAIESELLEFWTSAAGTWQDPMCTPSLLGPYMVLYARRLELFFLPEKYYKY